MLVRTRKRGDKFEYVFEAGIVDGKRKRISKSGFNTEKEAELAGIEAYNEFNNCGSVVQPKEMSYSDFLDYWLKNYCEVNLKYHTIQGYKNVIKNHLKPNLGMYRINQITSECLQEYINSVYVEKGFSKSFLHNILKIIKGSFRYAYQNCKYLKTNPSVTVVLPKYDTAPNDPAHIFTKKEVSMILERFKNNHAAYYAMLTAYYTGLRVSEVFGLTWKDIDLKNKTLTVNKNIIEKNQEGTTHGRHLSGNSRTIWYFGTCKTPTSYRTISIGNELVKALKEYKEEQEECKNYYGDSYMKHYIKETKNYYNNKPEQKIINAFAEIDVALPEVDLVFVKKNGVFEGTATMKYPFKVIHYELGIPCRFHDFRDTHATRLIEAGMDVKAVSKRLGHSTIATTYNIYVRVTNKMERETAKIFDEVAGLDLD